MGFRASVFLNVDPARISLWQGNPSVRAHAGKCPLPLQKASGTVYRQTIDGVTGFVFASSRGGVLNKSSLNKVRKRIVRDANETTGDGDVKLPDFSCHILRHTFCTNLIKGGVELTAASALMGHRDIQTTANIYNDIHQQEQKQKAMEQMTEYAKKAGTV